MGLDSQLLYEKRLAELERQIQALLGWKKTILATLATVIQHTSPVLSRRKTVAVVPAAVNGRVRAVHIPISPVVTEKEVPVRIISLGKLTPVVYFAPNKVAN
jgi:hypothetical protein